MQFTYQWQKCEKPSVSLEFPTDRPTWIYLLKHKLRLVYHRHLIIITRKTTCQNFPIVFTSSKYNIYKYLLLWQDKWMLLIEEPGSCDFFVQIQRTQFQVFFTRWKSAFIEYTTITKKNEKYQKGLTTFLVQRQRHSHAKFS